MRALKLIAPLGLAIGCIAGVADAQNVNYITLQNRDVKPISVDIRVGASNNCMANTTAATITIKPQATEQVKITAEKWACLRLTGTTSWRIEPLKGGQDYSFYVN